MRIWNLLSITLALGPLCYPLQTRAFWPFTSNKRSLPSISIKRIHTASSHLDGLFDISLKSAEPTADSTNTAQQFYDYINQLNELRTNPTIELLTQILDGSHALPTTTPQEEELKMLLLAKCALAEAHLLFTTVLKVSNDVQKALIYWQTELKKQHSKSVWQYFQGIGSQEKVSQDMEDKIETLENIQRINIEYLGKLANFIAAMQHMLNKTHLNQQIQEHAKGTNQFLHNQTDTDPASDEDVNRILAHNVAMIADYENIMKDDSKKDLDEPGNFEKYWLLYATATAAAGIMGYYGYKHWRKVKQAGGQAYEALDVSVGAHVVQPVGRLKQVILGERSIPLISQDRLTANRAKIAQEFDRLKAMIKTFVTNTYSDEDKRKIGLKVLRDTEQDTWVNTFFEDGDQEYTEDEQAFITGVREHRAEENPEAALRDFFADTADTAARVRGSDAYATTAPVDLLAAHARGELLAEIGQEKIDAQIEAGDMGLVWAKWRDRLGRPQGWLETTGLTNINPIMIPAMSIKVQHINYELAVKLDDAERLLAMVSDRMQAMDLMLQLLATVPAFIVIWCAYKGVKTLRDKATSKQKIYRIMQHIMHEVGHTLNLHNSYIKTSLPEQDRGYLIFWTNKLRSYSDEVPKEAKDDFLADIDELEAGNEVRQQLETFNRMYNSYPFLRGASCAN